MKKDLITVYHYILRFSFYVLLFTFICNSGLFAQQTKKYFKVEKSNDVFLESYFLLYLPEGYDSLDQQWPLLLFLHGSGERGTMIELVKKHGPPKMIENGYQFPYIVVSPQCPEDQWWSLDMLDMLLTEMVQRYKVDTTRIYITGLSMGGYAAWQLAIAYPDRFAAIVPVCGGADAQFAPLIKDLPIWAFHGAKDDVVPLSEEENMVNALKGLGSAVKFTVYPEAGHDAWTAAYNDEEMWKWLEAQHK
jgi:predicted peptidase